MLSENESPSDCSVSIYILASHEGCYLTAVDESMPACEFISSHPMRDAMETITVNQYDRDIYILASHEGCYL